MRLLLAMVANPNATPLMQTWMEIIEQDNRKGVMAGHDTATAMQCLPVTYRPVGEPQKRLTDAQRNTSIGELRRGEFRGRGRQPMRANNNLTIGRVSPARRASAGSARAVLARHYESDLTGFTTPRSNNGVPGESAGKWQAVGYWEEVVSTKGVPFLMAHFTGAAVGRGHAVTLPSARSPRSAARGKAEGTGRDARMDGE